MLKKAAVTFIVYLLLATNSFGQSEKEDIDARYKNSIITIKHYLSASCITTLSPIFNIMEQSHQLFLNDNPLDAVLNNVQMVRETLPSYKNSGCDLGRITEYMMHIQYMSYYLKLTNQIEKPPVAPNPTDFEKLQLVSVANSISNKIYTMCSVVTCDDYPKSLMYYCDTISKEMQSEHPNYYEILKHVNSIKSTINQATYFHVVKDKRYYDALTWVLSNMTYLYKVPKRYLFDLYEPHDFRHSIASNMTDYLINYTKMDTLDAVLLATHSSIFYYAAQHQSPDTLLASSLMLDTKIYRPSLKDASTITYFTSIAEWFNNEAYEYFKSYYSEHAHKK